jgi:orotidine-5'-phosphate decarboxylase
MRREFIIALDFPSMDEVKQFLSHFEGESLFLKIGMELFYQEGPKVVTFLKEQGHRIFLDLKLHDIPNTVKSAMKGLARLEVDLVNVHASGGKRMMEAAMEGLESGTPSGKQRPYCIAVTQLTSTSEKMVKEELMIDRPLHEVVFHYASLAKESGLDGIVCSVHEVPLIRKSIGRDIITVTPGIRLSSDEQHDQIRVATPQDAYKAGSTAIVVGRSITKSPDPYYTYQIMKEEWEGVRV